MVDVMKHLPHKGVFIVIPTLEGWLTKAKEAAAHDVKVTLLDTNPVFQCLGEIVQMASPSIDKIKLLALKQLDCHYKLLRTQNSSLKE